MKIEIFSHELHLRDLERFQQVDELYLKVRHRRKKETPYTYYGLVRFNEIIPSLGDCHGSDQVVSAILFRTEWLIETSRVFPRRTLCKELRYHRPTQNLFYPHYEVVMEKPRQHFKDGVLRLNHDDEHIELAAEGELKETALRVYTEYRKLTFRRPNIA